MSHSRLARKCLRQPKSQNRAYKHSNTHHSSSHLLTLTSNIRERARYAEEKAAILSTSRAVRDNTLALRAQLASAQRVLELRKGYDELAAKLIDPRKLKPRAETREDLVRLEKELEDLEQEGQECEALWVGRREAFERVVGEGEAMMRFVKGVSDGMIYVLM